MAIRSTLACLDNFIGVRADCGGDTAPGSGLYMNDLPGLTLSVAGDVAPTEFANGLAFLGELIDRVVEEEAYKMSNSLGDYVDIKSLLSLADAGRWAEQTYLAAVNEDRGIEICIAQADSMKQIRIHSIEALTNTTGARNIIIEDLVTGNNISTNAITLVAGQTSEIQINTTYSTPKLWVKWNTNDIAVNDSGLSVRICTNCDSGFSKGYAYWPHVRVYGRKGTDNNEKCTFGLRVKFSVLCSPDALLCLISDNIKYAMLYACGIRFAQWALATDRYNHITNLRLDDFEDKLDFENPMSWVRQYQSYMKMFSDHSENALSIYGGDCIKCRSTRIASGV